jgi:predicted nucleotidyltransferase/DNA-binding XRE family transcriptional regulator
MTASALIRDARRAAGLSQAELARRAGTSQPAIARYESGDTSPSVVTLDRLLRAAGRRLELSAEPIGRAHDASSARMRKLRAQRREILALARAHGARNVRIFGSVARGDDTPTSDIDLLVDAGDDYWAGLAMLSDLRAAISEQIDERVDVWALPYMKEPVAASALAEAVRL